MEPKAASFAGMPCYAIMQKNKHTIISIEFKEILLPFESTRITSIDLCPNICNNKHLRVARTLFGLELEQKQTHTSLYISYAKSSKHGLVKQMPTALFYALSAV